MKNASGSNIDKDKLPPALTFFSQRTWRIAGLISLLACAGLAWLGTRLNIAEWPWWGHVLYWGGFFLFLLFTMYMVIIDLRYIKLQYLLEERALFHETLGEESLQRLAREKQREDDPPEDN